MAYDITVRHVHGGLALVPVCCHCHLLSTCCLPPDQADGLTEMSPSLLRTQVSSPVFRLQSFFNSNVRRSRCREHLLFASLSLNLPELHGPPESVEKANTNELQRL